MRPRTAKSNSYCINLKKPRNASRRAQKTKIAKYNSQSTFAACLRLLTIYAIFGLEIRILRISILKKEAAFQRHSDFKWDAIKSLSKRVKIGCLKNCASAFNRIPAFRVQDKCVMRYDNYN